MARWAREREEWRRGEQGKEGKEGKVKRGEQRKMSESRCAARKGD